MSEKLIKKQESINDTFKDAIQLNDSESFYFGSNVNDPIEREKRNFPEYANQIFSSQGILEPTAYSVQETFTENF